MIFLIEDDFILQPQMKQILVTNNQQINTAEKYAIDEMSGYLSGRFNTAAIFGSTGANREPTVVRHTAALAVYHAQKLISPMNIPAWVKEGRDDAKSWGEMVLNNQLNPELPLIEINNGSGTFRFGGAKKITRRF